MGVITHVPAIEQLKDIAKNENVCFLTSFRDFQEGLETALQEGLEIALQEVQVHLDSWHAANGSTCPFEPNADPVRKR